MNQKQVWENIAKDWYEQKNNPIKEVMKFLSKQQGKILDLGSGAGRHLIKIKNSKMYLIDFSEKMIKFAKLKSRKENIPAEFRVSEMHSIPYKDNFFDAGICTSSLHCIPDKKQREQTIKELYRVLKPNAQVYITLYNKDSKQFKNSEKEKLIRWKNKEIRYYYIYDEKEAHELFKKNRFKIIKKFPKFRSIEFIAEKI